eukprot:XP_027316264.1 maestro heat-like repeat-containing protein family member 2B [Anas platyrhynchos]
MVVSKLGDCNHLQTSKSRGTLWLQPTSHVYVSSSKAANLLPMTRQKTAMKACNQIKAQTLSPVLDLNTLEQWAKVVNVYICTWKGCSLPATEKEQLYESLSQVLCSVASTLLDCQEEEDKQAVIGAMTPLMRVLLHKEEHWEQLLWLLHQDRTVQDASRVTKVTCGAGPGTAMGSVQVARGLRELNEQKAELSQCILLQACICPEETILFLESQLGHEREAVRVAALGLLGALARCDEPTMAEKLPQVVEAVKRVCRDPSIRVRRAVLHFIRELLSANAQSCSAWDVVGYIFSEFSQSSSRRAVGLLSAQEEGALQGLCMDVLGSLDISERDGQSKSSSLLWPRLLIYVMPAKYTGMLIPLSLCLRTLAESNELTAEHEHHELDPDVLNALLRETTLTPHNLLARLLVVAGSPFAGSDLQAAALLVLQSLHSRIHGAVGATWNSEIPLLLQYLQGKGNSPDAAEWERRLLQFLRASLETIGDDAWIKRLSCVLSQRLDSSPSSSGEKAFLYKALGTTLGACQELPHVQENLLQHLTRAQPEEPSEAQVSFPALSLGEGASPGPAPGSSSLPTTVAGHD